MVAMIIFIYYGKINTINIVGDVFGKDTTTTKFKRTYEINTYKYFKCKGCNIHLL